MFIKLYQPYEHSQNAAALYDFFKYGDNISQFNEMQ